jgi:thiamine-phosphate pyrophosphorylase
LTVDFKLYLITDRKQTKPPLHDAVRLALKGGVRAIQLRERDLPIREQLKLARAIRTLTREFNARLFIRPVDALLLWMTVFIPARACHLRQ